MKKVTIGLFATRVEAENAIDKLHKEMDVDQDDISYVYKDSEGEVKEVDADEVSPDTAGERAGKGAKIGGTLGALAGIGAAAGMLPVIGPVLAAGPLLAALGIGGMAAGAIGGAATGAAAGGLIGALSSLGVDESRAQVYSERVEAGDILVSAQTDHDKSLVGTMVEEGALEVNEFVMDK